MTGRTHDLAAFTTLSAVVLSQPLRPLSVSTLLLALLANQIGGIAPDLDQPTAPFWRNLPIGGLFGKMFGRMSGGHRFLTHSILGVILASLAVKTLLTFIHPLFPRADTGLILWAFIIGILSHLVLDSITREGVPWLLPIPYKFGFPPFRNLRMITGKKMEFLVVFPLLLLGCGYLYASHYPIFLSLLHNYIS